jgi:glycosyltransferase involved in cell wall biosynthesis
MKILIIVNEFPPDIIAGTALSTFYLSKQLARIGHDVHVAVTVRGRHSPRIEQLGNVTVYRLNLINLKGTKSLQRLIRLFQLVSSIGPDIIQGQALSCGLMAALIGCILKKPSITYIQGFDLYHASTVQKFIELRTALKYSNCILAVTDDLKAKASAMSGRPDIIVMPHGLELDNSIDIEIDRLRREAADLLQHRLLLYVGQLHERKGLPELLDAMKKIHAEKPDVVLAIIGHGHLEKSLREHVRRENLGGVVHFLGARPHCAVMAFMRLADVFVLPSREEPFGIVLIEAMSQGLPIVATDVQNIPCLVRQGVNGFLVDPRNPDQLAEKILRMIENTDEAAAIGRQNRKDALRFDWNLLVARYDRIYADLRRQPHDGVM